MTATTSAGAASAEATPAGGRSRRALLKAGAALGLGALAAPALLRRARAASGELNLMGWSGYDIRGFLDRFTAKTGIAVNFIEQPDQDSMFAQVRLAQQAGTVDMAEPTLDRVPAWIAAGLVQPWDESKLAMESYEPAFVTGAAGDAARVDGRRYLLPTVWGTEALAYAAPGAAAYGTASLADLFDPTFAGKVTMRAQSALAAMGRVLDAQGKLPRPFLDSFRDEAAMRPVWDAILAEAIRHKANVAQVWASESGALSAFRSRGCTLGLVWDTTGLALEKADPTIRFVAPKEGAFAWMQGFLLAKTARNAEQAHAFARYVASPEGSAAYAAVFAANPTGRDAMDRMDPAVAAFCKAAYPDDALRRLWWWPAQPAWFLRLRGDYIDRWKAA